VATAEIDSVSQLLQYFIEKELQWCNSIWYFPAVASCYEKKLLLLQQQGIGCCLTTALFVTAWYDYWTSVATAGYLVLSSYYSAVASCRADGIAVATA
jgi:hypothetical protein